MLPIGRSGVRLRQLSGESQVLGSLAGSCDHSAGRSVGGSLAPRQVEALLHLFVRGDRRRGNRRSAAAEQRDPR